MAKWYEIFYGPFKCLVGADGKPVATDYDTLAFKLEVKCEKNHLAEKEENRPHKLFKHANGDPVFVVELICSLQSRYSMDSARKSGRMVQR